MHFSKFDLNDPNTRAAAQKIIKSQLADFQRIEAERALVPPPQFSAAELNAFRDSSCNTMFDPKHGGVLLEHFEKALAGGLAEKWGIDARATICKLRALTHEEQLALHNDIAQFWRDVAKMSRSEALL